DAALAWRTLRNLPVYDVDPAALADSAVDLHALPLRQALEMRRQLIHDYGIAPERVRLVYDDQPRNVHFGPSRFERAHLFALERLRFDPQGARDTMLDAMRGDPETAAVREGYAAGVAERLYEAHAAITPQKFALVWVRDTRMQPEGVHHYDIRPEF